MAAPSDADLEVRAGTIAQDKGKFGFIRQDSGEEDMFVLPATCVNYGGILPPIGTRVEYTVVTDARTGRPRAEDVRPEGGSMGGQPELLAGTMLKDNGSFGFIKQDNGEADMFIMGRTCESYGGNLPAVGERIVYEVVTDQKTGRPRAENVRPERGAPAPAPYSVMGPYGPSRPSSASAPRVGYGVMGRHGPPAQFGAGVAGGGGAMHTPRRQRLTGEMVKHHESGKFGFLRPDSGEADMFVLPVACDAFDGQLPAVGTRVSYDVVQDQRTGRPRAADVEPEGAAFAWAGGAASSAQPPLALSRSHAGMAPGEATGYMSQDNGNFGFIKQDVDDSDMFVLPAVCPGFNNIMPPVATRVRYTVVVDQKTGRPRADNVWPIPEGPAVVRPPPQAYAGVPRSGAMNIGELHGAILQDKGSFGFIQQDSGEADMFVMPAVCTGFAGPDGGPACPPPGTRVVYNVVVDQKTGRPRADNVRPELGGVAGTSRYGPIRTGSQGGARAAPW